MGRKSLIRSDLQPYHLYNRTTDKVFYGKAEMPHLWRLSCDLLNELVNNREARIHAFVLMDNHYHLVMSTPLMNVDAIMRDFQSKFCKRVLQLKEKQAFRFCGPYKWELIDNAIYYSTAIKYVYQNPVRAGLVDNAEDYPFSTLAKRIGISKHGVTLCSSALYEEVIPEHPRELKRWVNERLAEPEAEGLRKKWTVGLRKGPEDPHEKSGASERRPRFKLNTDILFA